MENFIGKYVVVRASAAGVHAGVLMRVEGDTCQLQGARRLYRWRVNGNKGVSLSDVATFGLDKRDTKLGSPVNIAVRDYCEIIECSREAAENIAQFATFAP